MPKTPQSLKVPLQSTTKAKQPVFVYVRRSTTNKQELSLQRQEDDARDTIIKNGYREEDVQYFIESSTAYNGIRKSDGNIERKRTEFTRMLKAIDESSVPVIILTYEHSRLSRNDLDTQEILDRLFGEYDPSKRNIEKIIFNGGEVWTPESKKGDIKGYLLKAYQESETIGLRSSKSTLRELRRGRFIYRTPIGIDRLKRETLKDKELGIMRGLTTNEKMPVIQKIWEMKAQGASKSIISEYLAKNGVKLGNTIEQYFKNPIYMGYYPDPETGELLKMKFEGGRAPIPEELWYRVQKTLGKKQVSKYGIKQTNDAIATRLKWEEDNTKAFSVEFPKGKYRSYKSNAFGGFNKSERKIMQVFIQHFGELIHSTYQEKFGAKEEYLKNREETIFESLGRHYLGALEKKYELFKLENATQYTANRLIKIGKAQFDNWASDLYPSEGYYSFPLQEKWQQVQNSAMEMDLSLEANVEQVRKNFRSLIEEEVAMSYALEGKLRDGLFDKLNGARIEQMKKELYMIFADLVEKNQPESFNQEAVARDEQIETIKGRVQKKEQEKKNVMKNALRNEAFLPSAEELVTEIQQEIDSMQQEIGILSQSTDIEQFLERLPEIFRKTFELSKKSLTDAEVNELRPDLLHLLELTTFELQVDTKKELRIKLFEALEGALKGENELWLGY